MMRDFSKYKEEILQGFELEDEVLQETIDKYKGKIPNALLSIWKEFGYGTLLNSYLKIINPDKYINILEEIYDDYEGEIPIIITAFADIIAVDKDGQLIILNLRFDFVDILFSKWDDVFYYCLSEKSFLKEDLQWEPYEEAVNLYGKPKFDECFAYVPLLSLGGSNDIKHIKKVKLIEHIEVIKTLQGTLEF